MRRIRKMLCYYISQIAIYNAVWTICLLLLCSPVMAMKHIGIYGLFEIQVKNSRVYSNPFDFRVIELKANFLAPSGRQYEYFGFYDGNGVGGLTGNVWKLRFMPDEVGTWHYTYSWTDRTSGGSGNFIVEDKGLPGPLKIATDNPRFFEDARGNPFHWRGYSLHLYLHWKYGRGIKPGEAWIDLQDKINTRVADRKYNVLMLEWPVITKNEHTFSENDECFHFWQQKNGKIDFSRYYIPQWKRVEQTIKVAAQRQIYIFQFLALVDQYSERPGNDQMLSYLRYMAARFGPYWNNFGYSATWEYHDIWSEDYANSLMTQLHNNLSGLPEPPLLSIHDHSNNLFKDWLGFSMRQLPTKTIFKGNVHGGGVQGGVGTAFLNSPIVGSEDIWELCGSLPCNGTEVRRGAWGEIMAGVMPVYLENTNASKGEFNGEGEPAISLMFDFFYFKTRYRQYQQLNNVVSEWKRQIASGIPGEEYLVYDENGDSNFLFEQMRQNVLFQHVPGFMRYLLKYVDYDENSSSISIDLSDISSSDVFSVLWLDPATGIERKGESVTGGVRRTLTSPFAMDTVLLLRRQIVP